MTISEVKTIRVDDIPLILAMIAEMNIVEIADDQITPHGLWQGCSVGTIMAVWLCYMITQQNHCMEPVEEWAKQHRPLLEKLLGIELRDSDFNDDRLSRVLDMLSQDDRYESVDLLMSQNMVQLYHLPTEISRHDSTTSSVYHEIIKENEELLGHGHSKDHRPDLAQFKVMLSTTGSGIPLGCHITNGKRADDPLYIPSYEQVAQVYGHRDFLAVGDSKMGAWGTRSHLARHGSHYLCPYKGTAAKRDDTSQWVEKALSHPDQWEDVYKIDDETGEMTLISQVYEWSRPLQIGGESPKAWTERVLVAKSLPLQKGLTTRRLKGRHQLMAELKKLGQPAKRGQKRYRSAEELRERTDQLIAKYHCTAIVTVKLAQDSSARNGERWIVADIEVNESAWDTMIEQLGWQIYVTNLPKSDEWTVNRIIHLYRQQPHIENSMSYLKSRFLNIRPIFVRRPNRIVALTWLLILALRLITLMEFRVRRQLAILDQFLAGLKPSQPTFKTQRPTAKKMLEAFDHLTLVEISVGDQNLYHFTPLTEVQTQILTLLQLPVEIYTQLTEIDYKPLFNLRE